MRVGKRLGDPDRDSLKVVLTGLTIYVLGYPIQEPQIVRLTISTATRRAVSVYARYRWRRWPSVRLLTQPLHRLPINAFTPA